MASRKIRVVPASRKDVSQESLESALDAMVRMTVTGSGGEISANWLTRVLSEVLRRRKEEDELLGEVGEILKREGAI